MLSTVCENSPAGCLAVPLNIRCSRKWASPDLPGVSSAEPTLYQIISVTTGVRWSGITTTWRPLLSVKLAGGADVTVVWARVPPADRTLVESSAAKRQAIDRYEGITILVKSGPDVRHEGAACYTARL